VSARDQAIRDCIKIVETEEELEGPIPERNLKAILANPELASRACVRATKASITRRLEALLEQPEETFYYVTFEWRSLGRGSSGEWRRENEAVKGCPGAWWVDYLKKCREINEGQRERFRETGYAKDEPRNEEHRFLCATPITKAAFESLS
jgi:hypothetical protein